MSAQERDSSDEIQQLRNELQLVIEERQALMMHDMREMMVELMRNNGPSESSSAESSAAVRASPRGAEPTAVRGNGEEDSAAERGSQQGAESTAAGRQNSAAGAATGGGGARGYTTAARETIFREDASRSVGVTGRRGAAVPVEVGPARGQPDQPRVAGEWGSYPGGELGVGSDMPLPRLALKHTAVPQFGGKKPDFIAWTRDARYYAKGVGFLSVFVSDPPQYVPVGELDIENSVLVGRGYNRERVHIHALAWNFLLRALKSKNDRVSCTGAPQVHLAERSVGRAPRVVQPSNDKGQSDLSRRLNSFKIAPGTNPLDVMGRIEDLAVEMRTAGMSLDDHMLYAIFIDALPAEYEVEARNLASRDSIGRDYIIKAVRERHHRLSGSRKKGSNAGHAGHAMFAGGGDGGHRKEDIGDAHGKGGGRGKGKGGRWGRQGRGGNGTNEDGSGLATAAGGDGSSAKAADGGTSEVRCHRCGKNGHWRVDCTEELCSRCHGRGHAADVCPTSKEEAVPAVSDDDDYDDTVETLAFRARETGKRSNVSGKEGEG